MATWQCGNEASYETPEPCRDDAARGATGNIPVASARSRAPVTRCKRGGQPRPFYAATRAGKKKITAAVTPDVHLRFRQLGLEAGKGNETLLTEAISDLFVKYGKPPIA